MSSIIHMGGGGNGGKVEWNIFCQPTEPENKNGIWIKTGEEIIPEHFIMDQYFSQCGNFLGDVGNLSEVLNEDEISRDMYFYSDRFLWRPFVGTNIIYFVGAERARMTSGDTEGRDRERTNITPFYKKDFSVGKPTKTNYGYKGGSVRYTVKAGTNAFELNGSFYFYTYAETFYNNSDTPYSSYCDYMVKRYKKMEPQISLRIARQIKFQTTIL